MWCEPQFTKAKKFRRRSSISSERDGKNIEWREQMGVKKISRLIIREKCVDVLFYEINHAMGGNRISYFIQRESNILLQK